MLRIAVVTSSRADYGLLAGLLRRCRHDRDIDLQLLVTGMHLLPEYADTHREILADNPTLTREIPLYDRHLTRRQVTSREAAVAAMARGVGAFAEVFVDLRPQVVVVLGDRFEILAVAQSALLLNIPIAHIHGGEVTEGALDEAVRHSVTKMAVLHFVATDSYRRRVIQLGEDPDRVFNVGAPGLENLEQAASLSRSELESALEFPVDGRTLLVTYHPETLSALTPAEQIFRLLSALAEIHDARFLFTAPNIDAGGGEVMAAIEDFVARHEENALLVESLGHRRYLSTLNFVGAVVGNSSSGIIEVPSFGIPTVNIGDRQRGRVRAASVIDVECDTGKIIHSIRTAMAIPREGNPVNPYFRAETSGEILAILKSRDLQQGCRKVFRDIPFECEPGPGGGE